MSKKKQCHHFFSFWRLFFCEEIFTLKSEFNSHILSWKLRKKSCLYYFRFEQSQKFLSNLPKFFSSKSRISQRKNGLMKQKNWIFLHLFWPGMTGKLVALAAYFRKIWRKKVVSSQIIGLCQVPPGPKILRKPDPILLEGAFLKKKSKENGLISWTSLKRFDRRTNNNHYFLKYLSFIMYEAILFH